MEKNGFNNTSHQNNFDDIVDAMHGSWEQTAAMLQAIMDCDPDLAIFVVDSAYRLQFFNQPCKNIVAANPGLDVVKGMNLLDCFPVEKRSCVQRHLDRALKGESHRATDGLGSIACNTYETSYNPLKDEHGNIIGATAVTRGIPQTQTPGDPTSDLAQRVETDSRRLGRLAHDFNNLLSGLFGYIEVARNNIEKNNIERVSLALARAAKSYDNALAMTRHLQAIAKELAAPVQTEDEPEPIAQPKVSTAPESSNITTASPPSRYQGTGPVLVLDDEESVRHILGDMIESLGYTAVTAATGEEALSLFDTARQSDTPFVACILDLTIPRGLGGKEVAEQLKDLKGDTVLLATSGYSADPVMTHPQEFGFDGRLSKPFRIFDLSQTLAELLTFQASH